MRRPRIDPFPGELKKQPGRHNVMTYVVTEEQEAWLRRWFPVVENTVLMEVSGMCHSTLHRLARKFALTKSEQGLRDIKRRQAAHVKRLCERNGYYASLRGKPVSEACREGTRRMWQEWREGKRESPLEVMKRENPGKWRRMWKKMGETRRALFRSERRKALYAMERKTRLRVPLNNYTRSQTSHRYNALRRGYILMTDCSDEGGERWNIYYDADTQRTAQFERNLVKDGFKVLPWQEEETSEQQ